MSIRVMSAVWEMDLPAKDKLVLLALADCANDEGVAWPSIATLAKKCGCDQRTIQRNLRDLEKREIFVREEINGRGCRYIFNPRQIATPGKMSPATKTTKTPGKLPPKPSRTVNRDLADAKSTRTRAPAAACPPDVNEQVWKDFVAMRRAKRSPVTETALAGIKREADKAGWSLNAALAECAARGWQGFKADWVQEKINDRQQRPQSQRASTREIGERVAARFAQRGNGDPQQLSLAGPTRGYGGG